jgi:MYXO-CTERM domain-containing protein
VSEVVELFQSAEGRWRWRYRTGDVALESNESYDSVHEARHAARIAYPRVPVSIREGTAAEDSESSGAIGWLALLLVIVVLLRARRAR